MSVNNNIRYTINVEQMPLINLNRKEKLKRKYSSKRFNLNNQAVYNTNFWRKLRLEYLRLNPLCELCNSRGKVTAASEVHHIIPISTGGNINEKKTLGYDWNNLKALCSECHKAEHQERQYNNDTEK